MFKQIVPIIALSAAMSAQAQDSITGPDKIKHFGLSVGMAGIGAMVFQSPKIGFGACMAVGVAKEVYDARTPGHTASAKDLIADAAGCVVGAYVGGLMIRPRRDGVAVAYMTQF